MIKTVKHNEILILTNTADLKPVTYTNATIKHHRIYISPSAVDEKQTKSDRDSKHVCLHA